MPVTVSLQQIKDAKPCKEGWLRILAARGGDSANMQEQFPLVSALESNPVAHVLWALRCVPNGRELAAHYALGCAEMVRNLMHDQRSIAALDGVAVCLRGEPVDMPAIYDAARDAAHAAADAACAARDAYATTHAADAAARAADAAARAADAAYAAADAAYATTHAAYAAARAADAAYAAAYAAYAAADAACAARDAYAATHAAADAACAARDAYAATHAAADAARCDITERQKQLLRIILS